MSSMFVLSISWPSIGGSNARHHFGLYRFFGSPQFFDESLEVLVEYISSNFQSEAIIVEHYADWRAKGITHKKEQEKSSN